MMIWVAGMCIGLLAGALFPGFIPKAYSVYIGIALLAAFDSLVGGINAKLLGKYDKKIFLSGFVVNALIAMFLVYTGKLLGLEFHIAAIVVFGGRLFQNFASIRRILLNFPTKK